MENSTGFLKFLISIAPSIFILVLNLKALFPGFCRFCISRKERRCHKLLKRILKYHGLKLSNEFGGLFKVVHQDNPNATILLFDHSIATSAEEMLGGLINSEVIRCVPSSFMELRDLAVFDIDNHDFFKKSFNEIEIFLDLAGYRQASAVMPLASEVELS